MDESIPSGLFPFPEYEQWKQRALRELGEKPFGSLVHTLSGEVVLEPYYAADHQTAGSGEFPGPFRREPNHWEIRQWIAPGEVKAVNAAVRECLMGGAEALSIQHDPAGAAELQGLLDGVWAEMISLHFENCSRPAALAEELAALAVLRGHDPSAWKGSIAGSRTLTDDELRSLSASPLTGFRFGVIRATEVTSVGADEVDQLAAVLAMGSDWLHRMEDLGMPASSAASRMQFNFSVGTDFLASIAMLRAFRRAWREVLAAFSVGDEAMMPARVHADTALDMMAGQDIHTNLLRTTTAAMSAVIGGADSVLAHACDVARGATHPDSLRWARNIQHLLREESALGQAGDAAAGAWTLESLTRQVADAAWSRFLVIEAGGGWHEGKTAFMESVRRRVQARPEPVRIGVNKYLMRS